MEMYGFARAGVPGEYSPTAASSFATTDIPNTVTYSTILTNTVTILEQGELLTLIGSLVSQQTSTGGGPTLRFTVDGTAFIGSAKTTFEGGGKANPRQILIVPALVPGPHVVTLDWINGTSSTIKAASVPQQQHAILVCQRSRSVSSREMDGFSQAGWPMIYTCGPAYQLLIASKSSSATTPADSLFASVQAPTRYAHSALLIRLSVSGFQSDTGAERSVVFQVFVDGIAVGGTGNSTGIGGFANVSFNAGIVCLVPVNAGMHLIDILWGGGASPGTTINPSVDGSQAAIIAEEVFCNDVESLPDQEGFSAYAFAAKNLPRVGYSSLTADFTNGGSIVPLLQQTFYVSGENSAILVEFTGSLLSNGVEVVIRIAVDGVLTRATTETTNIGFVQCVCVEAAMNVTQGQHLIQAMMNGITTFSPASNPTFSHANMVIREIAGL